MATSYRFYPGFDTGVKPDEAERLAMFAEECGENTQAKEKIIRHGFGSYHPADPTRKDNRANLRDEIIDLMAMITVLINNGDIPRISQTEITQRIKAKKRYTHFQGPNTVW